MRFPLHLVSFVALSAFPTRLRAEECVPPTQQVSVSQMCGFLLRDGMASKCQTTHVSGKKLPGEAIMGQMTSGLNFVVLGFDCRADYLKELADEDSGDEVQWRTINNDAYIVGHLIGKPNPKVDATKLAVERNYFRALIAH